ncbi:heptaprenyl diphosphate synthase [candidate division KSB1 bacterium]|nr:MAG: heptaprenyl diphosphate synthase [candidate division KSB1 bacterium]RKY83817.1 MAG: heptaprenyl diphosphate synthase [candidate division KSB1 bacterium]HDI52290.1 Gx transporter family protein [Bacteroidota bacterium]
MDLLTVNEGKALSRLVILALLTAGGVGLFVFESLLPQPLPGGKIGLSQVATIFALYLFGLPSAFAVILMRIFITSLLMGTMLNPIFIFALAGGIVSTLTMGLVRRYVGAITILGNSVLGALTHNATQLVVAYVVYIHQSEIFWLLPYLILISLVAGLGIGLVTRLLLARYFVMISPHYSLEAEGNG